MDEVVLFGNGINRSCGGISWALLLKRIANNFFVGIEGNISAPIEYERIANNVLTQNRRLSVDTFSYDIVKQVDNIPESDYKKIYKRFMEIPVSIFLTTNYDYALERTIAEDFTYDKYKKNVYVPQETKCSKIRHIKLDNKQIYHIHGELSKPDSICLGNVHYVVNLNKIINTIAYIDESGYIKLKNILDETHNVQTWAEYFFTKQLFIVGLGLDHCDIDLWWLITYRAQLIAAGEPIKNKIIYYYLYEEGKRDNSFIECLKAFKIIVKEQLVENSENWKNEYIHIAEDIKKESVH